MGLHRQEKIGTPSAPTELSLPAVFHLSELVWSPHYHSFSGPKQLDRLWHAVRALLELHDDVPEKYN